MRDIVLTCYCPKCIDLTRWVNGCCVGCTRRSRDRWRRARRLVNRAFMSVVVAAMPAAVLFGAPSDADWRVLLLLFFMTPASLVATWKIWK